MHRLPTTQDFSAELRRAFETAARHDQLQDLVSLAQLELNYLQTIQFNQCIKQLTPGQLEALPRLRLAILASATVDHLLPALTVAGFRQGLILDVHATPFDQYRIELLQADSDLHQFRPQVLLFSLSARDALSAVPISASAAEIEQTLAEHVADLVSLWKLGQTLPEATILQQTFLNVGETMFGSLDRTLLSSPAQVVRQLNQRMVEAAVEHDVAVLDLDRPVERLGLDYWFDNAKWLQAKIEISPVAALRYGDLVARIIATQQGLSKKCLVLDLDNTLWGGVVGDDGIENITLGEGSGLGEAYLAFQRYAKLLADRGVVLAVCSKNETATAKSVFETHPEMVLRLDDIAAFFANWDDKATNLLRIAEQLNIGVESLVFVDDNPAERALIRQTLPMVAVPEMPEDPSKYVECLSDAGYFESLSFTRDDMQRKAQYAANQRREALQLTAGSVAEYLTSLQMTMQTSSFAPVDLPRIAQLINKTNQFNTTTLRRSLEEIKTLVAKPGVLTLQVRLSDRFGDNGLVSAVIMQPVGPTADTYEIDSWVMSCRVFGRRLEYAILNSLVTVANEANAKLLVATYRPTPKNAVIKSLFADLGFQPMADGTSTTNTETRWNLDLTQYTPHTTQIENQSE